MLYSIISTVVAKKGEKQEFIPGQQYIRELTAKQAEELKKTKDVSVGEYTPPD